MGKPKDNNNPNVASGNPGATVGNVPEVTSTNTGENKEINTSEVTGIKTEEKSEVTGTITGGNKDATTSTNGKKVKYTIDKLALEVAIANNVKSVYYFEDGNVFLPAALKFAEAHAKTTGLEYKTIKND